MVDDQPSRLDRYRLAAALGVVSVPPTVLLNWTGRVDSLPRSSEVFPIVVACLIGGYLYRSRSSSSTRAGVATALVGGIPVVGWQAAAGVTGTLEYAATVASVEAVVAPIAATAGVVSAFVLLVVFGLIGAVCGWTGGWIHAQADGVMSNGSPG